MPGDHQRLIAVLDGLISSVAAVGRAVQSAIDEADDFAAQAADVGVAEAVDDGERLISDLEPLRAVLSTMQRRLEQTASALAKDLAAEPESADPSRSHDNQAGEVQLTPNPVGCTGLPDGVDPLDPRNRGIRQSESRR